MEYFKKLLELLRREKEEDRRQYEQQVHALPVSERRANGATWYPIAIRDVESGRGDYLTIELERTTHKDILHQFRFGASVALFSQHDAETDRLTGTLTWLSADRMKVSLRTDELPDWTRKGKLGVDMVFDENSYFEMEEALSVAAGLPEKNEKAVLVSVLTGKRSPTFNSSKSAEWALPRTHLNGAQQRAVDKILQSGQLAIVHGPPGTGKTTTLVQAIVALLRTNEKQVLVTAPSNAAVDLLSEKLSEAGLSVVRVGNPARVSERLMELTLDHRMGQHPSLKEVKQLKKQAAAYRDMAQKYKRNFGREEREQRKALFAEARALGQEVERLEKYISSDILARAQVITATLVGANHYSVRHLDYQTTVIDEAGQALEPACWIPALKARRLILAGDHFQLPPTIKSMEAAREGLALTLMEKLVRQHPESVVLLDQQYRMHEAIMGFPSKEFYEGRLKADASVAQRLLFPGDAPVLFIDTAGCGFEEKWEGTRISNVEEAAFLVRHLMLLSQELQTNAVHFPSIAVIAPYRHQVEILKQLITEATRGEAWKEAVSVNTVDSFQGQERDVVYISMTRSNPDNVIGFLSEIRRMNVAMTRARKKLVVIGDSSTLSHYPFYQDLIQYAEENGGYRSAWEWMET